MEPGQGYWRLVKALWFNDDEPPFGGNIHIFVDLLDAAGNRLVGKPVRISNMDGTYQYQIIITEAKPGELYATSFRMGTLAPWYRAEPWDGSPADGIRGMGYGCLDQPWMACHTSYGLTWQWCVAGTEDATATPTATPHADADTIANVCAGVDSHRHGHLGPGTFYRDADSYRHADGHRAAGSRLGPPPGPARDGAHSRPGARGRWILAAGQGRLVRCG